VSTEKRKRRKEVSRMTRNSRRSPDRWPAATSAKEYDVKRSITTAAPPTIVRTKGEGERARRISPTPLAAIAAETRRSSPRETKTARSGATPLVARLKALKRIGRSAIATLKINQWTSPYIILVLDH